MTLFQISTRPENSLMGLHKELSRNFCFLSSLLLLPEHTTDLCPAILNTTTVPRACLVFRLIAVTVRRPKEPLFSFYAWLLYFRSTDLRSIVCIKLFTSGLEFPPCFPLRGVSRAGEFDWMGLVCDGVIFLIPSPMAIGW